VDNLWHDVRYGIRILTRNPSYTFIAILMLALGIGANTTIFSLVNAIYLRPFPGRSPEQLVSLLFRDDDYALRSSFSFPDYEDLRDHSSALSDLAAYAGIRVFLKLGDNTEPASGETVTWNYFSLLGLRPAVGRFFLPDEDSADADPVVIISHGLWKSHYASDPRVLGEQININGLDCSIVGVAPAGFHSARLDRTSQFWVPLRLQPRVSPAPAGLRRILGTSDVLGLRRVGWLQLVGRLEQDLTIAKAQADLELVSVMLLREQPQTRIKRGAVVMPLREEPGIRESSRSITIILTAVVGFVLLVACANVANLLLGQAFARRKEVAIRAAVGASRRRLVGQFLAECSVVSLGAGCLGALIALWTSDLLYQFDIPPSLDLSLDSRVLSFAAALSLLTVFIFGLLPAVFTARIPLVEALKDEVASLPGGGRRSRLRSALAVSQVALSLVLLVGAGLSLRTLQNVRNGKPGFDTDRILLISMELERIRPTEAEGLAFYDRALETVRTLPGVEAASLAMVVPLSDDYYTTTLVPDDRPPEDAEAPPEVAYNTVATDYFNTMGIPVIRGRSFGPEDARGAAEVAIVNQALAERFWPGENPIGRQLRWGSSGSDAQKVKVVGLVGNTKQRTMKETPHPIAYRPLHQSYEGLMTLHVRAGGDPAKLAALVRGKLRALDESLPLFQVRTMEQQLGDSVVPEKRNAVLLGAFALLALSLASIGLYGVMSQLVGHRTREIGVRIALGARPRDVLRMVVARGMLLFLAGLGIGLAAAAALTRFLAGHLYGVQATDPATILGVTVILAIASFVACALPALRAIRVHPVTALRAE